MSIRQIGECFYTTTLQPNERLVAIALADFADDHGRAWPSLATIAEKIGYSRRQTQRLVQQLREKGYVEVLIDATWNKTPLYQLHPEALTQPEKITNTPLPLHEAETISGAIAAAEAGGDNLTPHDTGDTPGGDTTGTQGVTPPTPGGDTGDTQSVIEPSGEPSGEPSLENEEPAELALHEDGTTIEVLRDTFHPEKPPRPRNPGWDALTDIFGYDPEEEGERSLWGFLAAKANAEPDPDAAVKGRARAIIGQWGTKALTAASLKKHWQWAGSTLAQASDSDVDRLRDGQAAAARRQRMAELEGQGRPRELEEPNGNTN